MASIVDERGFNQGFVDSLALQVRSERRTDAILKQMEKINENTSILELGCGTGLLSFLLCQKSGAKVTGIDLSEKFIDEARAKYVLNNLNFEVHRISNERTVTNKFDFIVGNGILHHLYYELDQSLLNIKNNLNSNGKIIFWEPNLWNPYIFLIFSFQFFRKRARLEPDEMAFSKYFIVEKLKKAGFINIKVECRDFLLPNTPDFLINPVIKTGNILEKIPFTAVLAQSLFIVATNNNKSG